MPTSIVRVLVVMPTSIVRILVLLASARRILGVIPISFGAEIDRTCNCIDKENNNLSACEFQSAQILIKTKIGFFRHKDLRPGYFSSNLFKASFNPFSSFTATISSSHLFLFNFRNCFSIT